MIYNNKYIYQSVISVSIWWKKLYLISWFACLMGWKTFEHELREYQMGFASCIIQMYIQDGWLFVTFDELVKKCIFKIFAYKAFSDVIVSKMIVCPSQNEKNWKVE